MDYVWELIQPWIAAILAALGSGGIITVIVRAVVKRIMNKNNAMLDAAYNAEKVSQLTAEKLAGKTMNIDVTAVTEKALKKTALELDERVVKVEDAANSLKGVLIAMAKGIIKLKALSEDEKTELASAIKTLEKNYKPPEADEIMTVRLTPIELHQEPEADAPSDENTDSGVNFGGLDAK